MGNLWYKLRRFFSWRRVGERRWENTLTKERREDRPPNQPLIAGSWVISGDAQGYIYSITRGWIPVGSRSVTRIHPPKKPTR